MAGPFCRHDWLVDIGSLMSAVAVDADICESPPQHTVTFEHYVNGGGLYVRLDADVCDPHEVEARAATGYQRSIKKRQT